MKASHGGKREGAGVKAGPGGKKQMYTVRLRPAVVEWLRQHEGQGELIEAALHEARGAPEPPR